MTQVTTPVQTPAQPTERKLSIQGRIRVAIENRLETFRGKRVNISGAHYKLVQAVAAHLNDSGTKSFNGAGMYELRLTLAECLAEVDHFIACKAAKG